MFPPLLLARGEGKGEESILFRSRKQSLTLILSLCQGRGRTTDLLQIRLRLILFGRDQEPHRNHR